MTSCKMIFITKVKKMTKVGDSQTCQLLRVWRVIKGSNLLGHVRHKVSVSVHLLIKRFILVVE